MQKYFVNFPLNPLKIYPKYFLKYFSFFLEPKLFFFQNQPFQAFIVSETYIFIHIKNKLHTIAMSANSSGGGGVKALPGAKKTSIFCVPPLS